MSKFSKDGLGLLAASVALYIVMIVFDLICWDSPHYCKIGFSFVGMAIPFVTRPRLGRITGINIWLSYSILIPLTLIGIVTSILQIQVDYSTVIIGSGFGLGYVLSKHVEIRL